jgi:diketogulonate reductase-like aldo/keto reductase
MVARMIAHSEVDVSASGARMQGSLRRLGQSSVGLYQIHWPGFPLINNWATEAFVEGLATVQKAGLAKARLFTCLLCM